MVYVIPLVCFVIPLIIGVVAMRKGMGWIVGAVAVALVIFMAWAIWQGRQVSGWDGIGYAIAAVLMAAPGILGVLAGGAVGLWRRRKHAAD